MSGGRKGGKPGGGGGRKRGKGPARPAGSPKRRRRKGPSGRGAGGDDLPPGSGDRAGAAGPRGGRPAARGARVSSSPGAGRRDGDGPVEDPREVWRGGGPGGAGDGAPVVGVLRRRGRFMAVEPLFDRGARVTVPKGGRVPEGRIVLARTHRRGPQLERDVGAPDVARDVLEALLLHHGLPRHVAPAVEAEAQGVAAHRHDDAPREDLRDLPTFTIDPPSARDFDDAISARELASGEGPAGAEVRVWVHVADVAAHVRPGGAIDDDAVWRGTSVYVPGAVEPMLPPALSNGACSLVPHEDRPAVTVTLDLDASAAVVRAAVGRTTIRSDARLDYPFVDRVFAGSERAEDPWAAPLAVARRVAAAMAERRAGTTTALELDTGEPQFVLDPGGHVTGIEIERQTEAHRLIEHLMVAANEQVARLLAGVGPRDASRPGERRGGGGGGVPAIHRVHPLPTPDAAGKLLDQLAALGVTTARAAGAELETPEEAAAAIAEASRAVDRHARRAGHGRAGLSYLVLRALQQARYDPDPAGHAGLGLGHYCHFTSPIRRYPDLVCHRAVLALVGGGEDAPSPGGLAALAVRCSTTERQAMTVEREADRIARAFLLERVLFQDAAWGRTFSGEVTGLISAGLFVRFGGRGLDDEAFEGMLPVRRLGDDWWELDELGVALVGTRSGGRIRMGDPIDVVVERVEPERGRVTLAPAPRGSR